MANTASATALYSEILDPKTGKLTYTGIKLFQIWQTQLSNGLDPDGNVKSNILPTVLIVGRAGDIGDALQYIDANGVLEGPGADFARAYANKDTDHIADGAGSPLAGGKEAFLALVLSPKSAGDVLGYDGADWKAVPGVKSIAKVAHKFIDSYEETTGQFTQSQPQFTDIAGQLDLSQLPASGISGTATLAKITGGGSNGSLTFSNGLITAYTAPS